MPDQPPSDADRQTVQILYRVIVGRDADENGLRAYAGELAKGIPVATVAADMMKSGEFENKRGEATPAELLCRNAAGRSPSLRERALPPGDLATRLVGDPRVRARHAGGEPADAVPPSPEATAMAVLLYKVIVARDPDPGGLRAYAGQLTLGSSLDALAADMTDGTEFAGRLQGRTPAETLCAQALGRAPTDVERNLAPAALAVRLIADPAVRERLPVFEALHPEGASLGDPIGYRHWLDEQRWRRQRAPQPPPLAEPLLSLLVLVATLEEDGLEGLLGSVLAQTTPRMEVLVAGGQGWRADFALFERHFAGKPAVSLVPWDAGLSDAAMREALLARARGRFVAILDQGERLADDTVATLAPYCDEADILLTDEDAAQGEGPATALPLFGATWDPDRALAQRPCGLVAVRSAIARATGRWDAEEAEWDLLLKASLLARPGAIRRVPAVLRHRPAPASGGARAAAAAMRVVRSHLERSGAGACSVEASAERQLVRVVHPLPASPPLVSVIIPTRDRANLLGPCLEGVLGRTSYPAMEVLVVDNDSTEPETAALLERVSGDPRVRVLPHAGAFNWSALNNFGVGAMRGTVAVLLNNDIDVIDPDWLGELVSEALRPDVGVAGAKLLYPDGTVQHAGIVLGPDGRASHVWRHAAREEPGLGHDLQVRRTVSAVTGACMAIRRSVFEEVGGLEDRALKVTWSDTDLCLRVRAAGYRVVWTPHAVLTHKELGSRGSDDAPEAAARYARERDFVRARWGRAVDSDPFFSPNLEPGEGCPTLASRPRPWTGDPAVMPRA